MVLVIGDGSSNSSNIFYFVSVIKLFLSQPMSFNFFSDPPPHCEGVNGMHIFIPEHIKEVTDYFCMIADQITNRTSGLKLQSKSNYYTFTWIQMLLNLQQDKFFAPSITVVYTLLSPVSGNRKLSPTKNGVSMWDLWADNLMLCHTSCRDQILPHSAQQHIWQRSVRKALFLKHKAPHRAVLLLADPQLTGFALHCKWEGDFDSFLSCHDTQ